MHCCVWRVLLSWLGHWPSATCRLPPGAGCLALNSIMAQYGAHRGEVSPLWPPNPGVSPPELCTLDSLVAQRQAHHGQQGLAKGGHRRAGADVAQAKEERHAHADDQEHDDLYRAAQGSTRVEQGC